MQTHLPCHDHYHHHHHPHMMIILLILILILIIILMPETKLHDYLYRLHNPHT